MDSRTILLSTAIFATIGLVGCQTIKTDPMLSTSDFSHQIKSVTWKKSGEVFYKPTNANLETNESRIVFFRDSHDSEQSSNINIGVGSDNLFQVSLKSGHYSELIICNASQTINAEILNSESGKVISHSKNYQFIPQTTTYLQVDLSETGRPVIKQIPADEALVLLNGSSQQTHQISRVVSDCTAATPSVALLQQPIAASTVDKPIEIKNPPQFNVLFDFDSAGIKSNHSAVLDGMANFIQSYPQMAVTLAGHTDNKGPESYNLKLSQSRANIVKNILVDQYGLETVRLSSIGHGETMPIDTNNTEEGRRNNRRVVAIVSKGNN
ncbi:OmpA family protein [Psychrobacter sp. DAB_AL43B]|uniref:OmpA family protein n=1 Tax=Psychrobacter sp. DAB_AL43B TaxID=1028416 RepID=UPI0009A5BB59|nr:OmpA family protein [Psychrobacter sp. DAB_AL43B]SLJ85274.1 outer membrane porin [Psychrobacter sp. DAB_AL43B]